MNVHVMVNITGSVEVMDAKQTSGGEEYDGGQGGDECKTNKEEQVSF